MFAGTYRTSFAMLTMKVHNLTDLPEWFVCDYRSNGDGPAVASAVIINGKDLNLYCILPFLITITTIFDISIPDQFTESTNATARDSTSTVMHSFKSTPSTANGKL